MLKEEKSIFRSLKYDIYKPFFSMGRWVVFIAFLGALVYGASATREGGGILASHFVTLWTENFFWSALFFAGLLFTVGGVIYAYIEYVRYQQQEVFLKRKRSIIEVTLPQETKVSFAEMEKLLELTVGSSGEKVRNIFYGINKTTEWFFDFFKKSSKKKPRPTLKDFFWKSSRQARPLYSFEIVSRGGVVSFIIFIPEAAYETTLSAIYSLFPDANVEKVDDYSLEIDYNEEQHKMHAFEWKLDKDDEKPIKTYVEFETEKSEVSPLALLYDLFGSMQGQEQMWIQFLTRKEIHPTAEKHADNPIKEGYWKEEKLDEKVKRSVIELEQKRLKVKRQEKEAEEGEKVDEPEIITTVDKRLPEMASRILEKSFFEVGIRMIYIAPSDEFREDREKQMSSVFKLTNTGNNKFVAMPYKPTAKSLEKNKKIKAPVDKSLQLYRDRLYLLAPTYTPYTSPKKLKQKRVSRQSTQPPAMIMSSETLATICHFPMTTIKTPTVKRTPSKNIEPPENLPI